MAFSERSLDDYVDVAQRLADFRALYPTGSLQPADPAHPWEQAVVSGYRKDGTEVTQTFIVYTAAAYRTPDDVRPGIGVAWEIWPGRTPYTLGSELMNAETSAWGRAIVAVLASDSKRGVASRQEVAARRAEREDGLPTNADGSLSRSRTTDAEKEAAGVMTAAQQAEHTALGGGHPNERKTAKDERAHVTRIQPAGQRNDGTLTDEDPWAARAWSLPDPEHKPGTITPAQQRAIMARYKHLSREGRLAQISANLGGKEVTSTNELSYVEAQLVLGAKAAAT